MEEKITIKEGEEYLTLNTLLKITGIISTGGQAKFYLVENKVLVDGEKETRRGRKLYEGMKVEAENRIFLIKK